MTPRRCITVLAVGLAIAGCGGSGGGTAAAPSPSPTVDTVAADKAAITQAWEGFFGGGGTADSHMALLEDGSKFKAELTAFVKDPVNADLSAKVTDVQINGATAAVTYDLAGKGGVVLLGGSVGEAVKVGASWLVSKKTYCQLVLLQDSTKTHAGCS
jgi:hypothetical protein